MKDAVIVSAGAHRRRQGAERHAQRDAARTTWRRSSFARRSIARPGASAADVDDVILGCAMPEGRAGPQRRAHREPARRRADRSLGGDSQPLLLVRAAGDRVRRRAHHARQRRGGDRRRHRVDEHGADGRQQGVAQSLASSTRYPDVYLSTGLVAENHARQSGISREEQDAFALRSHQRALAAIEAGRFKDEIVPLKVAVVGPERRTAASRKTGMFTFDHRRGAAARHVGRGAREAAAGVSRRPARSPPAIRRRPATAPRRSS